MGGGEGGWRKIAELVRPPEAGLPAALQPGRDASGVWIPPSLAPFPAPLPPSLLALLLPPTICRALSPFLRARHPHFLASLGASLLSFPLLPVSELTLRLGILSHRPACSAVPLYSLALLGPSFASQETGETSPPMDSAVEDVSPKSQQAGPSEPPSAPLVLTARDVLVSRPELVIASPPDQQLERRATAPAGLAIADEEVLEQVAAVLRRHPSFAQQITRAYRPGTNPPTPSPRPRRDEAGSWANGRRSGGHRGHNAPLSLRHRNISESDVSGEPSQRGWKKVWRRSFYVITTTALVAISGQVYQERRQRLEYEEQRERLRNDSLTFGQAVRSALTMQSGLILVNMVLAARGVQVRCTRQPCPWLQERVPSMHVNSPDTCTSYACDADLEVDPQSAARGVGAADCARDAGHAEGARWGAVGDDSCAQSLAAPLAPWSADRRLSRTSLGGPRSKRGNAAKAGDGGGQSGCTQALEHPLSPLPRPCACRQ